jgi:hypothetical protein
MHMSDKILTWVNKNWSITGNLIFFVVFAPIAAVLYFSVMYFLFGTGNK